MQSNVAVMEATTSGVASNNIVRGPWPSNAQQEENTGEELAIQHGVAAVKANHVVETLLTISPMLFNNIELAGFDIEDLSMAIDCTFVIEAIKSLLMKHHKLYHPIQDIAQKFFITTEDGELKMADKLDLILSPCDDTEVVIHESFDGDGVE